MYMQSHSHCFNACLKGRFFNIMESKEYLKRSDTDDDARIDWGIIFCVLVLAVIGMTALYVALSHDNIVNPTKVLFNQAIWYFIGIGAVWFIMQFDAEQLWKIAPVAYGIGIVLLILVLFMYSRTYYDHSGAKSWFAFGPLTFQPSEVMKPAYILMLGRVVSTHNSEYATHTLQSDAILLGKMFAWTIPVAVLLKLQNDFGTMLVFFAILAGVVLVSGILWRIIVPLGIAATVVSGTAIFLVIYNRDILTKIGFKAYQFSRIDSWLNPSSASGSDSYQLWQSMKAIGSGQLLGKGFNVSHVYVPVRESGDVAGSAPIAIVGPKGAVYLKEGCIVAMRHIHMSPKDAQAAGVKDGDIVSVKADNERGTIFNQVKIRVDDSFTLEMHIDTDEANAAKIATGTTVTIIK